MHRSNMARTQPVLSPVDLALVDQMAELTGSKRTDVIKRALTVYQWFVRQSLTGSQVVVRKASGGEDTLAATELLVLSGKGNRLSPAALGAMAKQLQETQDPEELARIRESLTRGFYAK